MEQSQGRVAEAAKEMAEVEGMIRQKARKYGEVVEACAKGERGIGTERLLVEIGRSKGIQRAEALSVCK